MTAKQYLSQLRMLDTKINQMQEELYMLRCAAERTTPAQDAFPGGGGGSDRVGNILARMSDLDAEINREIDRLADLRREITARINALDDAQEAELLRLHYLELESWKRMSAQMHIGLSQLHRIHRRALKHLEYIYYI